MPNKAARRLFLLAALLLAVLGWLAFRSGNQGYERLLLARATEGARLSPEQIADFCAEEFLVTYEIRGGAVAQAHNYALPLTVIGTNSCYAQILSYQPLNGGFFTNAAWEGRLRELTLNAAAAFQLFGSYQVSGQTLTLNGQTWLVSGVIDDSNAENPHAYAPASVTGGQADSLLALLDGTVDAEYAQNALKQLGVYESSYTIVDVAAAAAAFGQRLGVAWRAALILFITLGLGRGWAYCAHAFPFYREELKRLYLREFLLAQRAAIAKAALTALALLSGLGALLTLALQILAYWLNWPGLLPAGHDWALGSFSGKLAWLHGWQPWGVAVFALYLLILALILTERIITRRRNNQ